MATVPGCVSMPAALRVAIDKSFLRAQPDPVYVQIRKVNWNREGMFHVCQHKFAVWCAACHGYEPHLTEEPDAEVRFPLPGRFTKPMIHIGIGMIGADEDGYIVDEGAYYTVEEEVLFA